MKPPTYEQMKVRLDSIKELVGELYAHEPCGGPLHIITDDGNVKDDDIVFCYQWLHDESAHTSVYIRSVCLAILHELALMSRAQRLVWWLRASIEREGIDPIELCVKAHEAQVIEGENGGYGDQLVVYGLEEGHGTTQVIWEGLDQLRKRKKSACTT